MVRNSILEIFHLRRKKRKREKKTPLKVTRTGVGLFTKKHFSKKFIEFFLSQTAPGEKGKLCVIDYEMKVSPLRIISLRFFSIQILQSR